MINVKKQKWGQTNQTFRGWETDSEGRRICSKGTHVINPNSMIPIHLHKEDNEDYIPVTSGIKIIVLSYEQFDELTSDEIKDMLVHSETVKIGESVKCPKGYAHALYNTSDKSGAVDFIKYC